VRRFCTSIFAGLLFAREDIHQIHCKVMHWPLDMEIHSGCILQGPSPAKYTFENSTPPLITPATGTVAEKRGRML
jgi:hypothetical protein